MKRGIILAFTFGLSFYMTTSKAMNEFEKNDQFDKRVLCKEISQLSKDKGLSAEIQTICNIKPGPVRSTQGDAKVTRP